MSNTEYRRLTENDVSMELFAHFDRTQNVTECLRKIGGEWVIKDIDDWSPDEYRRGVQYLRKLTESGGYAVGTFIDGQMKGFTSV